MIITAGALYALDSETPETAHLDYIRGRGNSTWKAAKKPYRIRLKDKVDVFGLGKNRH